MKTEGRNRRRESRRRWSNRSRRSGCYRKGNWNRTWRYCHRLCQGNVKGGISSEEPSLTGDVARDDDDDEITIGSSAISGVPKTRFGDFFMTPGVFKWAARSIGWWNTFIQQVHSTGNPGQLVRREWSLYPLLLLAAAPHWRQIRSNLKQKDPRPVAIYATHNITDYYYSTWVLLSNMSIMDRRCPTLIQW